jgi:hypothetical protein
MPCRPGRGKGGPDCDRWSGNGGWSPGRWGSARSLPVASRGCHSAGEGGASSTRGGWVFAGGLPSGPLSQEVGGPRPPCKEPPLGGAGAEPVPGSGAATAERGSRTGRGHRSLPPPERLRAWPRYGAAARVCRGREWQERVKDRLTGEALRPARGGAMLTILPTGGTGTRADGPGVAPAVEGPESGKASRRPAASWVLTRLAWQPLRNLWRITRFRWAGTRASCGGL